MSGKRMFLGWSRPPLPLAAEFLVSRSSSPHFCDLGHVLAVVPGREAGRRLLDLLLEAANGQLIAPKIITQGRLPEELYEPKREFASDLIQQMVWAQALQQVPRETLNAIVRNPPASNDRQGWLKFGDLLRRQHAELAADRLDFSDVVKRGGELDGFDETPRWEALAEIQKTYLGLLDELKLWDQQTARLVAIDHRECRTSRDIYTIGTVDLNRTTQEMLGQVRDQVTALIAAPEQWKDYFDPFGGLISERWSELNVELKPEQIVVVDDAAGQVEAILQILEGLEEDFAIDDVTVGVPDSRLVPVIQRTCLAEGVKTHWLVDRPIQTTGPYLLLDAVANYLDGRREEAFSALVRHPDFSHWLQRRFSDVDWLSCWDEFVSSCLIQKVEWFPEHFSEDDGQEPLANRVSRQLVKTVHQVLHPLMASRLKLSKSASPVVEFLTNVYGDRVLQRHQPGHERLREVLRILKEAFEGHADLPDSFDWEMSAVDAIQLTLSQVTTELYRAHHEPAVQLSGWLDLPLDDAPVTIVTSLNEGFVPESLNHDLFLPNRLRTHLGLEDNNRRYARDLHHLVCMVSSRKVLRVIVSRRDVLNEPMNPSRLLFATETEKIPDRVLQFYSHGQSVRRGMSLKFGESKFKIPKPAPRLDQPVKFNVTEFRNYLASPYRYYLNHVLKLRVLSDRVEELDGAAFGVLMHDVLNRFGVSDFRDSTSAVEISKYLEDQLGSSIERNYGPQPLAAVLIQMEQAKRRLDAFAEWQADWRRQGWVIYAVERKLEIPAPQSIAMGLNVLLHGRVDRIDYQPDTGAWAVFDYKTGDAGKGPDKTHRQGGRWVDLQLPLYKHLASSIDVLGDVKLGYILLPRDTAAVREAFGTWSYEELAEADEVARDVIRDVMEQRFWRELDQPSGSMQEFDAICQENVFGREAVL